MAPHHRKPSFAGRNEPIQKPASSRKLLYPGFICVVLLVIIYTLRLSSTVRLEAVEQKDKAANYVTSFLSKAHKRPTAADRKVGSSATSSFYENWNWLKPFSSDKDYHDSKSVLPPSRPRCPIYVYYDQDVQASNQTVIDNEVMKVWRKAWWAAGFKPVILGTHDAMAHGQYAQVVRDEREEKITERMKYNLMRWLAWDHMGTGILADFKVFPMAALDDPVLNFLRRCEFEDKITRFENMASGLYAGRSSIITAIIKNVTSLSNIDRTIISPADLATEHIRIDHKPQGIAYYSKAAIANNYRDLLPEDLPRLINGHLHQNFHKIFHRGLVVLNSLSPATDVMTLSSIIRAQRIAQCPDTPRPESCPPNYSTCSKGCSPLPVDISKTFSNRSDVFAIGVIPHPYTTTVLTSNKAELQIRYIRRQGDRDAFLKSATASLGKAVSALYRAMKVKVLVVNENLPVNSLWNPAEKKWDTQDLEWSLGFTLPKEAANKGKTGAAAKVEDNAKNRQYSNLLKSARTAVYSKLRMVVTIRKAVESWNLADFEIWKFVSAVTERRQSERKAWSDEERRFVKGIWPEEKNAAPPPSPSSTYN